MYYSDAELEEKIKNETIQDVIDDLRNEIELHENEDPEIISQAEDAYNSMFEDYLRDYLVDGIESAQYEIDRITRKINAVSDSKVKKDSFSKIKALL